MGQSSQTARFFHRLVPIDDRLAFIAGASRKTHLASIEIVPSAPLRAVSAMGTDSRADVQEASAGVAAAHDAFFIRSGTEIARVGAAVPVRHVDGSTSALPACVEAQR